MDLGIRDRVAMVAAGTKGIGLACAKALLAEGCRVSVCSRSAENLERAKTELPGLHAFPCDVTRAEDLDAWHRAVQAELGEPDIVVTNTGGPPAGPLSQMTDEQWKAGVDATLLNVVRLVRLVAPGMAARRWGRIVHITSLVAKEPSDLLPISSTLRAGLMALTRLQANELAASGVTVNSVLPGHTLTDRQLHLANVRAERLGITPSEALQRQADEVPMKRLADPAEIAAAVAFLCSVPAAYITGVNLLVDGGLTRGLG
ncbi:MAG: SDR family oxidoreductase [Armatimonadetes bacterium]|nr:SDR family oxidoreductase [Armatimonadota bacterium]MCA1996384.1 SDR family oxidoreductase [Armatimonadota bacterium]